MTRLIYADEAIKRITAEYNKREAYKTGGLKLAWIEQAISGTPTVDAVPVVHGRWTADESTYTDGEAYCSVCKTTYYVDDLYEVGEQAQSELPNYCPHCGARMDAERKEKVRPYDHVWDMYLDEFEEA